LNYKFKNYEKDKDKSEFFAVTHEIRRIIETQQFEGASVGAFNPNIIARKLGLSEKTESQNTITLQNTTIKWGDKEINI
jgi:hypothetical protein